MKSFLLAIFSLCFAVSAAALAPDATNQAARPQNIHAVSGARLTAIMGTILEDGDKLRFVTEQRAWRVENPEILKGHEGHFVRAQAYLYPETNSIHVTEVKLPTASETEKDDIK
jgi:hypothetical protein